MEEGTVNENGGLSNGQLAKMVADLQKQLSDLQKKGVPQAAPMPGAGMSVDQFKEVIDAVRDRPNHEKFTGKTFVDEKDIDKEDYDEKGTMFCAYKIGYVIVDDVRQGFPVKTPFGNVIFFEYQGTKRTQVGKQDEVSSFSTYISHSKKEIQWLREHRYYNVVFFESAKAAMSIDAIRATRLVSAINQLMELDQHRILLMAKEKLAAGHKISIGAELKILRVELAHIIATEQADQEHKANVQRAISARAEEELVANRR